MAIANKQPYRSAEITSKDKTTKLSGPLEVIPAHLNLNQLKEKIETRVQERIPPHVTFFNSVQQ